MLATTILGYTITTLWYISLIFLSIVVALWPATMAKSKGRSFWLYFLISIPFWWITFFVVLFMKDNSTPEQPSAPTPSEQYPLRLVVAVRAPSPATRATHARSHFGQSDINPFDPSLFFFARSNPAYPFIACQRCDIFPQCQNFSIRNDRISKIIWHFVHHSPSNFYIHDFILTHREHIGIIDLT